MLSDAIKAAYDVMAGFHQQFNDAGNHVRADTFEHAIETIQQFVYKVGAAGASHDPSYLQLLQQMAATHEWINGQPASAIVNDTNADILIPIQGWQALLGQISTSTMTVAPAMTLQTGVKLGSPNVAFRPGSGGTTLAAPMPTTTSLAEAAPAMGIGAVVGAGLVGGMAGLALGSGKAAAVGAALGAVVGAGAGYAAKTELFADKKPA